MANIFSNVISSLQSLFPDENEVEENDVNEEFEEIEEYEEEDFEDDYIEEEEELSFSQEQLVSEEKTRVASNLSSQTTIGERSLRATNENRLSSYSNTRQETSITPRPSIISQKNVKESNVSPLQNRQEQSYNEDYVSETEEKTTIVLKYPRRYEDATEIVDLLIENECILIDFQFMLDAQARRCLDYLDGASHVLYGKLQKVSSTMYLLTPMNVTVDIEDVSITNTSNQDVSFDYDMKRR